MPTPYRQTRERGQRVLVSTVKIDRGKVITLIYERPTRTFTISTMGPVQTVPRDGMADDEYINRVMREYSDTINTATNLANPHPYGSAEQPAVDFSESSGLRIKMQKAMKIRKEQRNESIRNVLRNH